MACAIHNAPRMARIAPRINFLVPSDLSNVLINFIFKSFLKECAKMPNKRAVKASIVKMLCKSYLIKPDKASKMVDEILLDSPIFKKSKLKPKPDF